MARGSGVFLGVLQTGRFPKSQFELLEVVVFRLRINDEGRLLTPPFNVSLLSPHFLVPLRQTLYVTVGGGVV